MVETCKELGVSFEQTVARLKLRFDISEQEAQERQGIIGADFFIM